MIIPKRDHGRGCVTDGEHGKSLIGEQVVIVIEDKKYVLKIGQFLD